MKNKLSTKAIAQIAIIGALAGVIMIFDFPLLFLAPGFIKLDFSEIPCLIGGFALGPMATIYISIIKILVKTLYKGTVTAYVGELANFLMSISFCLPATIIYKKQRNKQGAIKGLILSIIISSIASGFINYYILIPAYINLAHFPLEAVISAGAAIYPSISNILMLVVLCIVPFNFVKGVISALITSVLYKRISPLLVKNR